MSKHLNRNNLDKNNKNPWLKEELKIPSEENKISSKNTLIVLVLKTVNNGTITWNFQLIETVKMIWLLLVMYRHLKLKKRPCRNDNVSTFKAYEATL